MSKPATSSPRAFCVRCVVLSLGGNESAVQQARDTIASEGRWECCHCKSTPFLGKVRESYKALSLVSPEDSSDISDDEAKDKKMAALIEQLEMAEEMKQYAENRTEEPQMAMRRREIEEELVEEATNIDELEDCIDQRLEQYRKHWKGEYTRIYDKITCIQDEMEGIEPGIIVQFYKFREADIGIAAVDANAKLSAEEALNRRDEEDGFNRGEFRGASGYIPSDPNVLKLEPEDLNESGLHEIEDVNTLEGAVAQMQENSSKKSNPWMSKTGTTALDVEMFKKKAMKVEQVGAGVDFEPSSNSLTFECRNPQLPVDIGVHD